MSAGAAAHVKNEASQFPDIEFSDARYDIVVLVGAGVIPETPVFEPDAPLSMADLAAWAALAEGVGKGGETPDVDALAQAALEHDLVESLEGDASYADIDRALFDGALAPDVPEGDPTRAEAASFVAARLDEPAGRDLLAGLGLRQGPTGAVGRVEHRETASGGSAYFVSIGDTTLPFYAHGRVANGPTDLMQWQGRTVRRSFVRQQGDRELWAYLEAEPAGSAGGSGAHAGQGEEQASAANPGVDRTLMYGLIAAVPVLGALLFFRRARHR